MLTLFKVVDLHKAAFNKANKFFINDGIEVPVDQMPVLMIVFYEGAMSQQEIAGKLFRDKSSILRSIASLESKGLVTITADSADKRKRIIGLTDAGENQATMVNTEIRKIDKMLFSCLTEKEKKDFEALLMKCRNHVDTL